jgi:hypothetical protein
MPGNQMSEIQQIVITVNGPGEISSWLYPFAEVMKAYAPHMRLCVALMPSVFRSGTESRVIKAMKTVDAVSNEKETLNFVYRGRLPLGFKKHTPGIILHFGGEPFLSRVLAYRLNHTLMFYGEGVPFFKSWFERIFLSIDGNEPTKKKNNKNTKEKVACIGNLMVDAARMRNPGRISGPPNQLTIGIFPGSRFYQVQQLIPFFMKVAREAELRMDFNTIHWVMAKADYLSLETIEEVAKTEDGRFLEGYSGFLEKGTPFGHLISSQGDKIEILRPEEVMSRADVAITIPGTNTAELAVMGIPMLVLLPTQKPELYPMPGLAGHLEKIPVIGKYIKRFLLQLFWRQVKYFSHPNRRMNREVVPEFVGKITATGVVDSLDALLHTPLDPIRVELKKTMGEEGAARRLVREILDFSEPGLQ